jgi:hypothetical protein
MIIGQTLMGSSSTYYSPWFPRQGDTAVFSAQIIAISATSTLTVVVDTKNTENTDTEATQPANGTFTGSTAIVISSGPSTPVVGLKELVRFKYTVSDASSKFCHFRVLPPSWERN